MFFFTSSCVGGLKRGMREESIQHLLAGLEEPKLSFSSYFKIRHDFQMMIRVII